MISQAEVFFLDVKAKEPILAVASPVVEPLKVCARFAEELKLHLLELTNTENESYPE